MRRRRRRAAGARHAGLALCAEGRLRLDADARSPAKRCSPSAPRRPQRPRRSTFAARRPDRGGGQSVLASCARSTPPVPAIAVMPVPHEGLGEAINDRLKRAAAPQTYDHADERADKPTLRSPRPAAPASRRSSATNTRSPIRRRRSLTWSRCATFTTAARRWCCGRLGRGSVGDPQARQ